MRALAWTCSHLLIGVAIVSGAAPCLAQLIPGQPPAEVDLSYSREGAYLGVGGGYAVESFDSNEGDHNDAGSVAFRAGYRGYPYFGVELLGEVLTKFEGTDDLDNDVHGFAVTVNAKGVLPLGRFEPFAMIGIGFLDIDADRRRHRRDDFAFRSAVGVDFYITPHWAAYAEAMYLLPTGEVSNYDLATFGAGILYRF